MKHLLVMALVALFMAPVSFVKAEGTEPAAGAEAAAPAKVKKVKKAKKDKKMDKMSAETKTEGKMDAAPAEGGDKK